MLFSLPPRPLDHAFNPLSLGELIRQLLDIQRAPDMDAAHGKLSTRVYLDRYENIVTIDGVAHINASECHPEGFSAVYDYTVGSANYKRFQIGSRSAGLAPSLRRYIKLLQGQIGAVHITRDGGSVKIDLNSMVWLQTEDVWLKYGIVGVLDHGDRVALLTRRVYR